MFYLIIVIAGFVHSPTVVVFADDSEPQVYNGPKTPEILADFIELYFSFNYHFRIAHEERKYVAPIDKEEELGTKKIHFEL